MLTDILRRAGVEFDYGRPLNAPNDGYSHLVEYVRMAYRPIAESHARLMAAAPELLEALRGVIRVADRATDEFDAARRAIAKATGSAA